MKFLLFIIALLSTGFLQGQYIFYRSPEITDNLVDRGWDILRDSSGYLLVNTNCCEPGTLNTYLDSLFPSNIKSEGLNCNIIYAKVFNLICANGLDIDYKVALPTRINYVIPNPSYEDAVRIEHVLTNNLKYNCFKDFIYLKSHYEQYSGARNGFNKANNSFENNIDALVNAGSYAYPLMVKNFLLSKYAHLTLAKFNQDVEDCWSNLKVIEPNNNNNEYGDQ